VLYFLVGDDIEPEVKLYASRRCKHGDCVVQRQSEGRVAVGFRDQDRAALFLGLFEDKIERSFETPARKQAAA
jgi:hypothetical protein